MNSKDTDNPGVTLPKDSPLSTQNRSLAPPGSDVDLKQFVTFYCDPVYSAIARLTGLRDPVELEHLTGNVLRYLWENVGFLSKEKRPGIFVYKALLHQVFSYLKEQGNEDRIRILRDFLPIDPACYRFILAPPRKSFQTIVLFYLRKIIQS